MNLSINPRPPRALFLPGKLRPVASESVSIPPGKGVRILRWPADARDQGQYSQILDQCIGIVAIREVFMFSRIILDSNFSEVCSSRWTGRSRYRWASTREMPGRDIAEGCSLLRNPNGVRRRYNAFPFIRNNSSDRSYLGLFTDTETLYFSLISVHDPRCGLPLEKLWCRAPLPSTAFPMIMLYPAFWHAKD